MNTRPVARGVAVLVAVLVAGAGAVLASPQPSNQIDLPKQVTVIGGRNAGEIEGYNEVLGHPGGTGAWTFAARRIADSQGAAVDPTWVRSGFSGSVTGQSYAEPPNGPGCEDHQAAFNAMGLSDYGRDGSINIERRIWMSGGDPGTYEVKFTMGGSTLTRTKNYNLLPATRPVIITVKDTAGNPVSGVTVATQAGRPYTGATTLGTTDASGLLSRQLPPQVYGFRLSKPGESTQDFTRSVNDLPVTGTTNIAIVFAVVGQTAPTQRLPVRINVIDATDQRPVKGASVKLWSTSSPIERITDASGIANYDAQEPGSYYAFASRTGYTTSSATAFSVFSGTGGQLTISLVRAVGWTEDPPEETGGGETGEDEAPGWLEQTFRDLFVPSPACWEEWQHLINDIKGWGPFGFISGFYTAFDSAIRAGAGEAYIDIGGDFGAGYMGTRLDFRDVLEEGAPSYEDGTRGTVMGSCRAWMRKVLGMMFWVLWALMLWKWFRPIQTV